MVIRDLDRVFKDEKGEPATWAEAGDENDPAKRENLTLRRVLFSLLIKEHEKVPETQEQKYQTFAHSQAISPYDSNADSELEMDAKFIAHLEKKAAILFPTIIYGQLYEILEGKDVKPHLLEANTEE